MRCTRKTRRRENEKRQVEEGRERRDSYTITPTLQSKRGVIDTMGLMH
jgi:hypothetical protein